MALVHGMAHVACGCRDYILAAKTQLREGQERHLVRPLSSDKFDFVAINVPSTFQLGIIPEDEAPPWGLLRVVACAREKFGFNAGILDAHKLKLSLNEIIEQIEISGAKLIGINPTSVNVSEGRRIADACDERKIPYILGGVHATLSPQIARGDFPNAFAMVRGDGELAIVEIIRAALESGPKSEGAGIYYNGHEIGSRTDYAKRINPADVPLIRQDEYVEEPIYTHVISLDEEQRTIHEATLYVTTGCPFECTFCAAPVMNNKGNGLAYLRPRMSRIVDEVEYTVNNLKADAIHFLDDMAFISGSSIKEFYVELQERHMTGTFIWRGLTRVPVVLRADFSDNVTELAKETGLWKLALGIESGNDKMLRQIKKEITKEQAVQAIEKLSRHQVQTKGFFIMGFPGETEDQIKETREFILLLKDKGMTDVSVYQFKPYPGTLERQRLVELRPELANKLDYFEPPEGGKSDPRYGFGKGAWLPDDQLIAEIPSWKVKEYILGTMKEFYGSYLRVD